MSKDAKGHGSEGRGGSFLARALTAAQTMNAMGQGHPATDTHAANALGQDHPKSEQVPTHGAQAGNSLAKGLHVDWAASGHNPHSGGGFAAGARARRLDKAAAYTQARASRSSGFKLT